MGKKLVTYLPIAVLAIGLAIGMAAGVIALMAHPDQNAPVEAAIQQVADDNLQVALTSAIDPGGGQYTLDSVDPTTTVTFAFGDTKVRVAVVDPGGGVHIILLDSSAGKATFTVTFAPADSATITPALLGPYRTNDVQSGKSTISDDLAVLPVQGLAGAHSRLVRSQGNLTKALYFQYRRAQGGSPVAPASLVCSACKGVLR